MGQLAISDWDTFTEMYAHTALGWSKGEESHALAMIMRETVTRETWLRYVVAANRTSHEESWSHARAIDVPTLVIQRKSYDAFSFIAGPIRGATVRMVDGESHGPFVDNVEQVLDVMFEFTGAGLAKQAADHDPTNATRHGTAIILFTDIADSTALTERMGDAAFRSAARALDDRMRPAMRECGGTPVEGRVLGDGVMAVFASAAQAIDAARRCITLSAESELRLHVGLHAGDVIREDDNVYGGAVNIAARICGLSQPGEILVSATIRDLARTSAGAAFEDRGEHDLKGIEEPVRVFAVRAEAS